jgi:hypothetical protein
MVEKKAIVRCQRCGKRLKKGGDNYRLECIVASDFDGYINVASSKQTIIKLTEEIELSGLTEQELEEQVYFRLKQKLCHDCRNEVVDFLKGNSEDE